VNEYTDWERPEQHPIKIRDETLEALSDAQVVAPVVHTADLHSAARRNSYLYVFDYQTKFGDYPQVRNILMRLPLLLYPRRSGDITFCPCLFSIDRNIGCLFIISQKQQTCF
jgi:hypothetical protein